MIFTPATKMLRPNAARIASKIAPIMLTPSLKALVLPVRDEDVRFTRFGVEAVRCPDEVSTIGAELREAIEVGIGRHLFEPGSVRIDQVQIEVATPRILIVGRENDAPTVRSEERSEVGASQVGDLVLVGAVRVHHPDLHLVRTNHLLSKQVAERP